MRNEGQEQQREDKLKTDNDYLKLKLMLEKGAKFGLAPGSPPIPAEVENQFLRDILEFESLNAGKAFIQVYEKIGRPTHFLPANQLNDDELKTAWRELLGYLGDHQITVGVCSPNVSPRDLYRFVTEELFDLQVSSVDMPGLVHGFIYDEFHPDPFYDNPRSCMEGFIEPLFSARPFDSMHFFRKFDLRLNEHYPLSQRQFMNLVNHFKAGLTRFDELQLRNTECAIEQGVCYVSGHYQVRGVDRSSASVKYSGDWMLELTENPATGVWDICSAQVGGICF